MTSFKIVIASAAIAVSMMPLAAKALPSTATGQISVGQVIEMIDKADTSPIARQTLIAYIAGVGETAGAIADTTKGSRTISCKKAFSLGTESVRAALTAGAPRQANWAQTPATPLIVTDMLKRAGCRAMSG